MKRKNQKRKHKINSHRKKVNDHKRSRDIHGSRNRRSPDQYSIEDKQDSYLYQEKKYYLQKIVW